MPKTPSIDPVVAENLKAIMRDKSRTAYSVATELGFSPNWLYRVLNQERGMNVPTLREVAAELGVSLGELVDPPGNLPPGAERTGNHAVSGHDYNHAIAETRANDYSGRHRHKAASASRPVEVLEVTAAVGSAAQVYDETPTGVFWFRDDWLRHNRIDAAQCHVITVRGDSMEPTLPDGCSILVDRSRRELLDRHIYVLRTEDGVVVKRLRFKNGWHLTSDNLDWPPLMLSEDMELKGEVRWAARTF